MSSTFGAEPAPTIDGDVVRLRPMVESDREALIAVLRDPTVVAFWDTRGAEVSADELIAGDEDWTVWAVEVDGRFAGSIKAPGGADPDYRHPGIAISRSWGSRATGYA